MLEPTTPTELLAAAYSANAARPLLTTYDDASGERVELSVATVDNWVAKTANFLVDGLSAGPGDRVGLLLPAHWRTATWLLACWAAGCPARPGDVQGCDIVVADAARLDEALAAGAEETVAVSLQPLGGGLGPLPPGVVDYGGEVLSYGDRFTAPGPVAPPVAALELGDERWSAAQLIEQAVAAADRWQLRGGARVLSVLSYDTLDGILAGLLAPLAVDGSVVLCRNLDPDRLVGRLEQEFVTAAAGAILPAGTAIRALTLN
ncbi:MAG: TIGR03089 family protein [Actinomycetota bacterium]|nr:TIGR03089 family protein [Acidothermales bacterium]MDQ3430671.1 TIGR03089 family protein [Actinomycetota bacterium]